RLPTPPTTPRWPVASRPARPPLPTDAVAPRGAPRLARRPLGCRVAALLGKTPRRANPALQCASVGPLAPAGHRLSPRSTPTRPRTPEGSHQRPLRREADRRVPEPARSSSPHPNVAASEADSLRARSAQCESADESSPKDGHPRTVVQRAGLPPHLGPEQILRVAPTHPGKSST